MAATLAPDEKAKLREFLEQRFNLEELENLAFDLGIDYNKLPHTTTVGFSRELIGFCERRDMLGNLVVKVSSQRPNNDLVRLSKLSVGSGRTKVQIIIAQDILGDPSEIIADLAAKLKIDMDQVELVGTAPGSLRLLVDLPQDAANVLARSEIHDLVNGKYRVISITAFDALDMTSQMAWRFVVRTSPADDQIAAIKRRRLFELKKQQAIKGIDTEPQVLIEIEELEKELGPLEKNR